VEALSRHYGSALPLQALGLSQLPNAQAALGALVRYVQATTAAEDEGEEAASAGTDTGAEKKKGAGRKVVRKSAARAKAAAAAEEEEDEEDVDGVDLSNERARTRGARLRLPRVYSLEDAMAVDEAARRNLELERTARSGEKRGSLLWALDATRTPMGARLLRRWLLRPSVDARVIFARQETVAVFAERHGARAQLRKSLRGVCDLERMLTRVETRRASPRCVGAVAASLEALASVDAVLGALPPSPASSGGHDDGSAGDAYEGPRTQVAPPPDGSSSRLEALARDIRATLVVNPPAKLGDSFAPAISSQAAAACPSLVAARAEATQVGEWLAAVEERERGANPALPTLKALTVRGEMVLCLKGEKVLLQFERSASLPPGWLEVPCAAARSKERRFVTNEIRSAEARLATAHARAAALELDLFELLLERVDARAPDVRGACERVARADVLCSFAQTAVTEGYCRPAVLPLPADGGKHVMRIERARHPVVEQLLPPGAFVPNPISLGGGGAGKGTPDLLVLTGPNAGGKSVYLRTLGVLQVMAQVGSFVPADAATLTVADRLFTRVGAVDDIGAGQSTFTVEMRETAEILQHATEASLVLLDEVGRGTAAADGSAIARAVTEHLAGKVRCRTLFATHLHEVNL